MLQTLAFQCPASGQYAEQVAKDEKAQEGCGRVYRQAISRQEAPARSANNTKKIKARGILQYNCSFQTRRGEKQKPVAAHNKVLLTRALA